MNRAELLAERDFLLRSLDDLDAELAAGDLSAADHRSLHDDYTRRAAEVIRELEGDRSDPRGSRPASRDRRGVDRRRLGLAAALVFSLGAGVLLARSTGERGVNDQITGSIESSMRTRTQECLGIAQGAAYLEAVECLDGLLAEDADNAEAWSYSGWFVAITGFAAIESGQADAAAELLAAAEVRLDRSVATDPSFPDAYAFRSILAMRRGADVEACAELDTLVDLSPPPFVLELVASVDAQAGCGALG